MYHRARWSIDVRQLLAGWRIWKGGRKTVANGKFCFPYNSAGGGFFDGMDAFLYCRKIFDVDVIGIS